MSPNKLRLSESEFPGLVDREESLILCDKEFLVFNEEQVYTYQMKEFSPLDINYASC